MVVIFIIQSQLFYCCFPRIGKLFFREIIHITSIEIRGSICFMKCSSKNALKLFQKVTYNIENVASNEANLEAKIEKKKVELERNQKRLQTLKKVRPAFMDEYEKMEEELRKLYEEYIVKFRCMTHLEQQIEEYERVEQEKMKERTIATRKIMERLRQDESMHQFDGKLYN